MLATRRLPFSGKNPSPKDNFPNGTNFPSPIVPFFFNFDSALRPWTQASDNWAEPRAPDQPPRMSLNIDWSVLDAEIAETVRAYLDDALQESLQTAKPAFIGSLRVLEFDFGTIPPEITIRNLCQPMPEFYLRDDESSDDVDDLASRLARSRMQSPDTLATSWPHSRLMSSSLSCPPSPFKPHLTLAESPMANSFPQSRPITPHNSSPEPTPKGPLDMQLELDIRYNGNMRLKVATELIINQPTFAFMTLPMALTLTGFNLAGTCSGLKRD